MDKFLMLSREGLSASFLKKGYCVFCKEAQGKKNQTDKMEREKKLSLQEKLAVPGARTLDHKVKSLALYQLS